MWMPTPPREISPGPAEPDQSCTLLGLESFLRPAEAACNLCGPALLGFEGWGMAKSAGLDSHRFPEMESSWMMRVLYMNS